MHIEKSFVVLFAGIIYAVIVMTPNLRNFLLASLAGLEILLTAAEGAAVLTPLVYLVPATRNEGQWFLMLVAGLLVWMCAMGVWLLPLLRGKDPEDASVYFKARKIPGRALLLRQVLWGVLGLGLAIQLHGAGQLPADQAIPLISICLIHSFVVGLVRWVLHGRLLRLVLGRANLLPPWREMQMDSLRGRLVEIAVLLAVAGGLFLCLFTLLFVPLSLEQYVLVETYFPWTLMVLVLCWYLGVVPRQVAPLMESLRGEDQSSPEVVLEACHRAHRLPHSLALTKIVFFSLAALLLVVESATLLDISFAKASLVLLAMVIVSTGTGIYEMIWSRKELRPVVAHLLALPGAEDMEVKAGALRRKMLLSFGGIIVFTVALSLFWTYLHHQNLRRDFAVQQARRVIAPVMERLRRQAGVQVPQVLASLHKARGNRMLFVPHKGPAPPMLSPTRVAQVRRRSHGALYMGGQGFVGAYERVVPGRPESGSVVALLPVDSRPRETLNLVGLVFFFLMVLAMALGVVFLTSSELTRPLGALERRAAEMTQGYLTREVSHHGEFDTSGRLSSAFEQMRQELVRKLRTIEKLNEDLEEKVRLRTAELERSNTELVEAMDALQQAQERLVTSEKLASVGQLVAGIAHEINNPINAVVNTVAPLSSAVEDLVKGAEAEQLAEHRQDLEQMLRVIRSGIARTQRIVSALRNYSRTDTESRVPMDLHVDIDETLALLQHNLKEVEVVRRFEATTELVAFRGQLNQALMNLLSNAATALEGCADARLVVSTEDMDDGVRIMVQDNGPGIPDDVRSRVFDPFFTTKEVGKGTGLGLSITHGIVERHGGNISVESEAGKTVFTMEIPGAAAAT